VASGINFLVPTNLYVFTALYALTFIGVALPNGVTWAMVSDVIDYGDWRTGVRREGITYSMFNFSRKLAQALAAAMAGVGLSWIGYVKDFDKTLSPQTADSVKVGIKGLLTLYPSITLALAAVTLLLLYPLTEAKLKDMLNDMYQRDASEIKSGDLPEGAELEGVAPTDVVEAFEADLAARHPSTHTSANDPGAPKPPAAS
jgi:GPH family glycoside/pentoside/hexuronide:cation symporter